MSVDSTIDSREVARYTVPGGSTFAATINRTPLSRPLRLMSSQAVNDMLFAARIDFRALSPLLVAQGLIARRQVPRWAEPPGARSGHVGRGPRLRLLIIGDSAAAGVGVPHQDDALAGQVVKGLADDFSLEWELDAVTGATTASALSRLKRRPRENFDVVVTSLGVNDVVAHVRPSLWRVQQAELRRRLVEDFAARLVIISGLPPIHGFPALPQPLRWHFGWIATAFDCWLMDDVAAAPRCHYLSLRFTEDRNLMSGDGFHPGPAVYAEWGRRVADVVRHWAE